MEYFQTKNSYLGTYLQGLATKDVGILYGHMVHLRPIGIFYAYLVYYVVIWYIFPHFGVCTKKNLATLVDTYLNEVCPWPILPDFLEEGSTRNEKTACQ
jgi:hypothetical protein